MLTKNSRDGKQIVNCRANICSLTYAISKFVAMLRKLKSLRITKISIFFQNIDIMLKRSVDLTVVAATLS